MILVIVIVALVVLVIIGVTVVVLRRQPRPPPPAAPSVAPLPTLPTLGDRLSRTRHAVGDRISGLLSRGTLDATFWAELEETLITGDVGARAAAEIVERVRSAAPADPPAARNALRAELVALFAGRDRRIRLTATPALLLMVGVNGTGKTTSIAKLAHRFVRDGKQVVLGAADTFRAGASEQLRTWAERVGAAFVEGEPESDPAAVAFRALQQGRESGADVVIVDTAGRLHSNRNLMLELSKIVRVLTKEAGAIDETLLVLDATTGQNAIAQAHTFAEAVGVTGMVLSKLDGTARGGVVAAVEHDLDIPVKLIGVGEGMEDLLPFEPGSFVDALLGDSG